MVFFGRLFVLISAALGLFVSGLDLLERFEVDVNGWLRGIPPVVAIVPERYGDWVDRLVRDRLDASGAPRMAAPAAMRAPDGQGDEMAIVERAPRASRDTAAMLISAGVAVVMAMILGLMSRGLVRRD